ncbi:hypothetical protein FsymDg_4030 [Candidatus Protofrankia datiscae]|uniref:Cardiolipin synthase N-terminal domain-containing protein n=1 Tax=Candidatus Protofrankia datiscae TaxID=2716812 RepID=F8AW94_9ACTN|nr:PLD nuclease N-terminal domain-containing protein [Protofrankia symbiont of Coriaria myrtifolia]AEH11304.1 hypothetical protein FsymDg_4030 [Candidatus Protofrankia datiscae]
MVGFVLTLMIFGFWIFTLIDAIMAPSAAVRTLPKLAWIAIIVFFYPLGGVAWLLVGRPRRDDRVGEGIDPTDHPTWGDRGRWAGADGFGRDSRESGQDGPSNVRWPSWPRRSPAPQPVAPDDNPEFLRELSERIRRGDGDGTSRT